MEAFQSLDVIDRKNLAMILPSLEEVLSEGFPNYDAATSRIYVESDILYHKSTDIFTTKKSVLGVIPSCVSLPTVPFPLPSHVANNY